MDSLVDSKATNGVTTTTTDFSKQVGLADVIIVNKMDLVDERTLCVCCDTVRTINAEALLITTKYGKVDLDRILNTHSYDTGAIRSSNKLNHPTNTTRTQHIDTSITTFTYEFEGEFEESKFDDCLQNLLWNNVDDDDNDDDNGKFPSPQNVLRFKAVVNLRKNRDVSFQVQAVYDMFDKYELNTREIKNRIIVIGENLRNEDIKKSFLNALT
jgi:G3E family GTPase